MMEIFFVFFSLFSLYSLIFIFFFFNDTATTEIYTLSLHDALPIFLRNRFADYWLLENMSIGKQIFEMANKYDAKRDIIKAYDNKYNVVSNHNFLVERSEEHTSELQSRFDLVCRLLLEKKKQKNTHK